MDQEPRSSLDLVKCVACLQVKSKEEFRKESRRKTGITTKCGDCIRRLDRFKYVEGRKNRARENASRAQRRRLACAKMQKLKAILGCVYCGMAEPACLDFHHLIPGEKTRPIARLLSNGVSIEKVSIELSKCEVVCANCHRILHHDSTERTEFEV